jgi:hypothetical protein
LTSRNSRICPISAPRFVAVSDTNDDEAIISDKDALTKLYKGATFAFGSIGAIVFVMPDTTMAATKFGCAAGFGIAAGLASILQDANKHGRLSSDTYKRLNVGLFGFSACSLLAVPGEAGFLSTGNLSHALIVVWLSLIRLYGTFVAFTGWSRSVGSVESKFFIEDMYNGTKATFRGLRVKEKTKALTYRNFLLLTGAGIFSALMDLIFSVRVSNCVLPMLCCLQEFFLCLHDVDDITADQYRDVFHKTLFEISLHWSAVARRLLIATIIYSLKDAAERDRLSGTTFIQLNMMIGLWAMLVGVGQAIYPSGASAYRGFEMFTFAGPFFIKALKGIIDKRKLSS